MIAVPSIQQEGTHAALLGTALSTLAQPMGFTFCPYVRGSVEHANFITGCVAGYFEGELAQ